MTGQATSRDTHGRDVMAASVADPAPLGFAAFALTIFLLSVANAGWMDGGTGNAWVSYALAYGGLVLLLAGMWEFRNRNVFGATAFSTYAGFWIGLALWALLFASKAASATAASHDVAWILLAFAIFNTYMLLWSTQVSMAVCSVFLSMEATEIILIIALFKTDNALIKVGGYVGVLTAACAWFTSSAGVLKGMRRTSLGTQADGPGLIPDPVTDRASQDGELQAIAGLPDERFVFETSADRFEERAEGDRYVIFREPGHFLVGDREKDSGKSREYFRRLGEVGSLAWPLSAMNPQYEYDIHHFRPDGPKGVIGRYKAGMSIPVVRPDIDCGGDGNSACAHGYMPSGTGTATCAGCGHSTQLGVHNWRPYPVGRYCPDCSSWLVPGEV